MTTTRPLLSQQQLFFLPIVLMTSWPFLDPHHRNPIQSFYPEWWAALFGLLVATCLLWSRYRQHFALPAIAVLPALLAALILIQIAILPDAHADISLLAVLYLLWAILLMAAGKALGAVHGQETLADSLASGIALGAILSALVVAAQWSDLFPDKGWISLSSRDRFYGNLNQPNHLALQIWLGIAALSHLRTRQRISVVPAGAAIFLLVMASLLTGSRALWLYAVGFVVLAGLLNRRTAGAMLPGAMLALAATGIGKLLLPWFTGSIGGPVGWIQQGSDGIRGGLWWMAVRMGLENPLSGIGWGQFSSASFSRIEHYRALAPASLQLFPGEHAHNIALNFFAELGVLAPIFLLVCSALWLRRVWRHEVTPASAFALTLLLFLSLHAQLEYTLWYTFFLGIGALALAITEPKSIRPPPPRAGMVALILLAAFASLIVLRQDYNRLEETMHWSHPKAGSAAGTWEDAVRQLVALRQHSIFGRYVDLAMVGAMQLNRETLRDKLLLCQRGIAFSPTDYAVFKCAALLALDGQPNEAASLFGKALTAYPAQAGSMANELASITGQYPELAPLLTTARAAAAKFAKPPVI